MEGFTPVIVSYHQFQVRAAADPYDNLDLYTMGDDLLQVTGRGQLTVLTGPHTGPVALAAATPAVQRAVAAWAARRACEAAGLATIDWIAPALAALDEGAPLPPPFDGDKDPWDRLRADSRVPSTNVTILTGTPNVSQQAIAFPAIRAAARQDALAGAVDAVYWAALAYGEKYGDLLAAARERL